MDSGQANTLLATRHRYTILSVIFLLKNPAPTVGTGIRVFLV